MLRASSDTMYLPPECVQGGGSTGDRRSDIYSIGAILYEMLTGRPPFDNSGDWQARVQRIVQHVPAQPRKVNRSIPAALEAICLKAMAKDPARRYATAGELAAALRGFLTPRKGKFWKR